MIKNSLLKIALLLIACIPSNADNISYEHLSNRCFTSLHVLVVNPKEHAIIPVKAVCRETVATLANRHGALAAINGGFWKLNGDPAGILKINHHWYGTPIKPRGAIGWSLTEQKVLIDKVLTNYQLTDGYEIEVIPASTSPEEWKKLEHIVGGTPVLIKDGNIIEDYSSEKTLESFLFNRHPRTAVGIRDNGDWVFVVVDGRFYGLFGGMTIKELAQLMFDLDCVEALNLDGGGSSTMVIEGSVVNIPRGSIQEDGKQVDAVSDAILIFPSNAHFSPEIRHLNNDAD